MRSVSLALMAEKTGVLHVHRKARRQTNPGLDEPPAQLCRLEWFRLL